MYYRIYRPFINKEDMIEAYGYLHSLKYCENREELIRYFQILQNEVKEIFKYIEPNQNNFKVYSLKIYQILVDICIEIENNMKQILVANGYEEKQMNMKDDYFAINELLHLDEYYVKLLIKNKEYELQPFKAWNSSSYTPLSWYQAYNNVKHNRSEKYEQANLENLLNAIAGLYVLLYSQFYEFANCIAFDNTVISFADDGNMYITNTDNIFIIAKKPNWKSDEKYLVTGILEKYFEK